MVSFENFVKLMPPSLSESKVTPSFCFPFKIPDDPTATRLSNIYLYQTCDSPGNLWWATVNLTAANLGPLKGQSTGSLQGPDRETGWPPEAQATWATWIPGTKTIPGIHGTTTPWAKIRTRTGLEPQRIITGQTTYVCTSHVFTNPDFLFARKKTVSSIKK